MTRLTVKTLVISLLLLAALGGGWWGARYYSLQIQIQRLEEQKKQLQQIISRLTGEKRVAEILVTAQTPGPDMRTTLLFVEYGPDGKTLPPKTFTISGNSAHLDALVIKFEHDFLFRDDPLRGHSIILFHRIFGDRQTPADAFPIDTPGQAPGAYQTAGNPQPAGFEQDLWQNFWRLADDENYRREKGVRVANPESVWRNFDADHIYTLTLEAAGGLNITARPIEGLWRQFRDAIQKGK